MSRGNILVQTPILFQTHLVRVDAVHQRLLQRQLLDHAHVETIPVRVYGVCVRWWCSVSDVVCSSSGHGLLQRQLLDHAHVETIAAEGGA